MSFVIQYNGSICGLAAGHGAAVHGMAAAGCSVVPLNCAAVYGGIVVLVSYAVLTWVVRRWLRTSRRFALMPKLWRGIDTASAVAINVWTLSATAAAVSYLVLARQTAPSHPHFDVPFMLLCVSAALWSVAVLIDAERDSTALAKASTIATGGVTVWFVVAALRSGLDALGITAAVLLALHHVVLDGIWWNFF